MSIANDFLRELEGSRPLAKKVLRMVKRVARRARTPSSFSMSSGLCIGIKLV